MIKECDLMAKTIENDTTSQEIAKIREQIIKKIENERPLANEEDAIVSGIKSYVKRGNKDALEKLRTIDQEIDLLIKLHNKVRENFREADAQGTRESIEKSIASIQNIYLILRGDTTLKDHSIGDNSTVH